MDHVATIKHCFKRIKQNFKYRSDTKTRGVKEHWNWPSDYEGIVGDCDDFALACRKLLAEHDIPSKLVICTTETDEAHLVCMAGNLILDNRHWGVKSVDTLAKKGYTFLFVSGDNRGDPWTEVLSL